jgi:hypothetical protein
LLRLTFIFSGRPNSVFKLIKWLLILALIVAVGALFWFAFGLWTGIYSVYSFPPSKEHPDGATLLVSRDEGEPMFNSPQYVPPPKKPVTKGGGLGFEGMHLPSRPLAIRTIVKLPYVEWVYKKSLEPATP